MSDPSPGTTRREALRRAAGLAALGVAARASPSAARERERVAIIGAGTGGVAAAYFLASSFGVDIFESRGAIGGHCDSRTVSVGGERVVVDLGAQFFHPDTHPIYVTLLEELGLAGEMLKAPAGLCIFRTASRHAPVFSSSHALSTPRLAVDFAAFTQLAREAVLSGLAWETTVDEWIRGLTLSRSFKNDILYPWITATIGAPRAAAVRTSARSILQTFALAFPADLTQGATTYNSRIGLQGNLQRMLDRSPAVRVHRRAAVQQLTRTPSGWFVRTPGGRRGPYRFMVLNAPPRTGRRLLRGVRELAGVTALLDKYGYFNSRLVIHTDPAYVHHDRRMWAAYNAGVTGRECEGSVWLGALQPELRHDVFKSWASRRHSEPEHVVAARRFQHPLITPATIAAARALRSHQGGHGLYFSGQYTTGFDLQESALYSAMQVAEALAPASPTLAALKARLALRGQAGISYEL